MMPYLVLATAFPMACSIATNAASAEKHSAITDLAGPAMTDDQLMAEFDKLHRTDPIKSSYILALRYPMICGEARRMSGPLRKATSVNEVDRDWIGNATAHVTVLLAFRERNSDQKRKVCEWALPLILQGEKAAANRQ